MQRRTDSSCPIPTGINLTHRARKALSESEKLGVFQRSGPMFSNIGGKDDKWAQVLMALTIVFYRCPWRLVGWGEHDIYIYVICIQQI